MHVQLFDIRTMQFSPLAKSWLVDSNFRRTRRVQRYHRSSLITKWADMLFNRLVGMISDLEISGDGDSNSIKESESLKVLRAVRVLRPLKIVSGIPSEWNMCSCCHWVIRGWSKNTSLPALTNQRNHHFYLRNWVHIHIQVFTQSNQWHEKDNIEPCKQTIRPTCLRPDDHVINHLEGLSHVNWSQERMFKQRNGNLANESSRDVS